MCSCGKNPVGRGLVGGRGVGKGIQGGVGDGGRGGDAAAKRGCE